MSSLFCEDYKQSYCIFFSNCSLQFSRNSPLQIWTSKVCYKDISKTITASSLRFGNLIEVGE